jgi:hypothetical protein
LKKQSQFVPGQIGAKFYLKGDYDKNPPFGAQENKAKQTQSTDDFVRRMGRNYPFCRVYNFYLNQLFH